MTESVDPYNARKRYAVTESLDYIRNIPWLLIGGPVGLPPPLFFILAGKLKIRKLRKRGKIDGPRN